ncbi:MAG: disulfide bond formation protein B [Rhodospirillaceae bacterium]
MRISSLFDRAVSGWRAPALLTLGGLGMIAAALFMQHVVGVQPCVLCLYQRWPYVIVAMLAMTALVFGRHRRLRAGLLGLCALAMLADTGIALFHVGIQNNWWAGTAGCGVPDPAATLEELRARILDGPIVRCDEVSWSLFGISLAGYNIPITLIMAAFALAAARRILKPRL